jgi:NAD(P)-dependent dehydrogenase (short-subunit alcohol dehydrogenase family)
MSDPDHGCDEQDVAACLRVLQALRRHPQLAASDDRIATEVRVHAALLFRAIKEQRKRDRRQHDQALLEETGIRQGRRAGATTGHPAALSAGEAEGGELSESRRCYVCKQPYTRVHFFYDALCPACGDFNYAKRQQTADLTGRVALVTGARVKIGFQVALKLLRAGAAVIATTRFPHDAARRYARENDFADWAERLIIYGIDLRHLPGVESFAAHVSTHHDRLDMLINNAAQTVRRPPAFYAHLLAGEAEGAASLPPAARKLLAGPMGVPSFVPVARPEIHLSAALSQQPLLPGDERHDPEHFPPGHYDLHGQQVDLRPRNSWVLRLGEVSLQELLEVHAVNALAPFLLLSRLEPLLLGQPGLNKFIVKVSAMEGQLNSVFKTGGHPHTNMAKAGLNMLTRTCAEPLARHGVFMNSVDTGWVTNEFPYPAAEAMARQGFQPPLDEIDGAARVCDPIFSGQKVYGKFLKDYREIAW